MILHGFGALQSCCTNVGLLTQNIQKNLYAPQSYNLQLKQEQVDWKLIHSAAPISTSTTSPSSAALGIFMKLQ